MDWLETKYIGLVSNRLRNYKRKSSDLYNFSCPFCGDSERDKRKARAYVYTRKGTTMFHCHNCGVSHNFKNFIRNIDSQLYSELALERLRDEKPDHARDLEEFEAKMKTPVFMTSGPLKGLKKVSQLPADHECKLLVSNRKIPNPYHAKLFYCPKFFSWVNSIMPGKFTNSAEERDEPRLLIPFLDQEKKLHAFQGRAIRSDSKTRYITAVYDETVPRVYGLDSVDFSRKTYVFEGPIDSMFVPNSIATAGGDLTLALKDLPRENMVIVYDNEPRSPETRKKVDKAIINGYNVCVWPSNLEHKDINDMILAGMSSDFIRYIIDTNTHRDLKAKLALNTWSKP